MARTMREWGLSFILLGIMVVTILILVGVYGPNALSNPTAVVILLVVVIISCCLLMFNRQITGAISEKARDKKQKTIICPRCMIPVDREAGICPRCGNKV